jgi:hypothetical protein
MWRRGKRAKERAGRVRKPWGRRDEDHPAGPLRREGRDVQQRLCAETHPHRGHPRDLELVEQPKYVACRAAKREGTAQGRPSVTARVGHDHAMTLREHREVEDVLPVGARASHPVQKKERLAAPALLKMKIVAAGTGELALSHLHEWTPR